MQLRSASCQMRSNESHLRSGNEALRSSFVDLGKTRQSVLTQSHGPQWYPRANSLENRPAQYTGGTLCRLICSVEHCRCGGVTHRPTVYTTRERCGIETQQITAVNDVHAKRTSRVSARNQCHIDTTSIETQQASAVNDAAQRPSRETASSTVQ